MPKHRPSSWYRMANGSSAEKCGHPLLRFSYLLSFGALNFDFLYFSNISHRRVHMGRKLGYRLRLLLLLLVYS